MIHTGIPVFFKNVEISFVLTENIFTPISVSIYGSVSLTSYPRL